MLIPRWKMGPAENKVEVAEVVWWRPHRIRGENWDAHPIQCSLGLPIHLAVFAQECYMTNWQTHQIIQHTKSASQRTRLTA